MNCVAFVDYYYNYDPGLSAIKPIGEATPHENSNFNSNDDLE